MPIELDVVRACGTKQNRHAAGVERAFDVDRGIADIPDFGAGGDAAACECQVDPRRSVPERMVDHRPGINERVVPIEENGTRPTPRRAPHATALMQRWTEPPARRYAPRRVRAASGRADPACHRRSSSRRYARSAIPEKSC